MVFLYCCNKINVIKYKNKNKYIGIINMVYHVSKSRLYLTMKQSGVQLCG